MRLNEDLCNGASYCKTSDMTGKAIQVPIEKERANTE